MALNEMGGDRGSQKDNILGHHLSSSRGCTSSLHRSIGEMGKLGSRPSGPNPFPELTLFPPSNDKGR